jgi:hypothetical protein
MPRQWITFELLHDQTVKPVEAAAQIHRRRGHQHPRGAGYTQHGSACNSWGNIRTSDPVCTRTIQPCGLTTSTSQHEAELGNRSSWNFTGGEVALPSFLNHLPNVDKPTPCRTAKFLWVISL